MKEIKKIAATVHVRIWVADVVLILLLTKSDQIHHIDHFVPIKSPKQKFDSLPLLQAGSNALPGQTPCESHGVIHGLSFQNFFESAQELLPGSSS